MNQKPVILVTNDDGVYAPGVRALFEAVSSLGHAVLVAPERDNSAVSHSLTMNRPLQVKKLEDDIYTLDGTPTDCITIGLRKILSGPPTLLVSGINPGTNLGDDISYSGTVSAAIEGTMYGVPSLAFSLGGDSPHNFTVAAGVAWKLASMALSFGLPPATLLNVNIPDLPAEAIKGIRFTVQGRRIYKDAIQETFDPWGRKHYWIGGGTVHWTGGSNTDEHALREGYISVTPIQLDLTNHNGLSFLEQQWKM
ncbi:MAG: 5'/3'-nucleotidase SurE [Proteobacteria bacterium]|nr:5'/3'-nucleotidase SurE [Pseudomonadota bacterium]MBU1138450.1 5'/3'-nucleotidase SurE [Pseudomonadota bacterium]MBU1232695.1 5'/3'-nucleotidase SurE [Pseudomonadota bacterium]MBU1418850.1 5'/3'-nucleotidase SurE [Pseudomonadota bacterium]MBU1455726.1 5'/3'-nucleotidase SurE [Pseudomonadota bacterium]